MGDIKTLGKPPPAELAENSTTLLSEFSSKFSIAGEVARSAGGSLPHTAQHQIQLPPPPAGGTSPARGGGLGVEKNRAASNLIPRIKPNIFMFHNRLYIYFKGEILI